MPKEPTPDRFAGLPVVTAQRMRELDALAGERFGLSTQTLMENAGRAVAEAAGRFLRDRLGRALPGASIVVCCGRGANGGDGLVAARHLAQRQASVAVFVCPPKKEGAASGAYPDYIRPNWERAAQAGAAVSEAGQESKLAEALSGADVVIDALLGTGSSGKPAGPIHRMIQEITRSKKTVLALDLPSGIHPDSGYHSGVFITAAATFTLGLPKRGLVAPHARRNVGKLLVLDIGYPRELVLAAGG